MGLLDTMATASLGFQTAQIMGGLVFFFGVYEVSNKFLARFLPEWKTFNDLKKERFSLFVASTAHCLMIIPPLFSLVSSNEYVGSMNNDHITGLSPLATSIFTFSASFFLFDGIMMGRRKKVILEMVAHHFACFLAYMIAAQPFLQFHAVRLLLFELSTPFLNTKTMMNFAGWDEKYPTAYKVVQLLFAIVFIYVRIIFGTRVSVNAFSDVITAYSAGEIKHYFSAAYLSVANLGLTGLNLFWGYKIVTQFYRQLRQLLQKNHKDQ